MKFILYKDGFGFAVYDPNDGSVRHSPAYHEATEASLDDWSDVLGFDFGDYHQIMCASSIEKLKSSLTDWRYGHDEIEAACGGDTALLVRAQVTMRRVQIDLELASRSAALPNAKLTHECRANNTRPR